MIAIKQRDQIEVCANDGAVSIIQRVPSSDDSYLYVEAEDIEALIECLRSAALEAKSQGSAKDE